jgi:AcrR family transcriptional regulator
MTPPAKAGPPPKPRREEKKAATREALLEAATKVFARQGYVAASVDDVAWEAGLTKGAVYSNFDSKDALFAAVIQRHDDRQLEEILDRVDWSAQASEQATWAGERFMAINDPDLFLLILEYILHATRFPTGQEPLRAGHRKLKAAIAETMVRMSPGLDWDLESVLPISEMVTAFFAMSDGVALQKLYDPDGCPDDLYVNMLNIFVKGMIAMAEDAATPAPSPTISPAES